MEPLTIVWQSLQYPGIEHLTLRPRGDEIHAESVVVGVENRSPFRLDYRLVCDQGCHVRALSLTVANGTSLHLAGDGLGHWRDGDGLPLPALDGCIDVDITATPFTNTLPIRRVRWQTGQVETLSMVYVVVPDLTVRPEAQRYTCLEKTARGALFRFEMPGIDFSALLPVDADGFVLDYPELFSRVWPR